MRSTSLQAYTAIKEGGLLSQLRFEVYEKIVEHGPMTANEMWGFYFKESRQAHSISPRFSELESMGVLYQLMERKCRYTGNNAIVWDVTDNLPSKPVKAPKRMTAKQENHECCLILETLGHPELAQVLRNRHVK